jgi:muramoyltetrapeptide carboxypeptidase
MNGFRFFHSAACTAITATLFGLALAACSNDSSSEASEPEISQIKECVAPAFLKKGDKIALLSPSYHTPDSNVENTAKVLEDWGFKPVVGKHVGTIYAGKYAGTADERAEDFIDALKDTSIKAILTNRGGYGAIHLIDRVDLKTVGDNPKWLIGFSDISTLHAMETKAGVMSIHGTMSSFIGKTGGEDDNSTYMRDLLLGKVPKYKVPANKLNIKGKAKGVLVGGNMATFVPLAGSPVDVYSEDGIILFLEELEETMRNLDRMFSSLELRGVLDNVKGVVLGEFEECGTDLDFDSPEAMLIERLKKYNIPVMAGFPAGHGDINLPIVMGATVTLDVTKDGATLAFDIDGDEVEVDTDEIVPKKPMPVSLRKMLSGKVLDLE